MRDVQEKFEELFRKQVEEHKLELVIDRRYHNTGHYLIQPTDSLQTFLDMQFNWQDNYVNFHSLQNIPEFRKHYYFNELPAALQALKNWLFDTVEAKV